MGVRSRLTVATGLFRWLFWRLPKWFIFPLLVLWGAWILVGFAPTLQFVDGPIRNEVDQLVGAGWFKGNLGLVLYSLGIVALFFAGLLLAYNIAVAINLLVLRYGLKPSNRALITKVDASVGGAVGRGGRLDHIRRIGLVLAGGGAKGAFQAGAMKAIWRFLEEQNALSKVTAIAATSIGSWNALFWMAGLVRPPGGDWAGESAHEAWWRSISARSLTAPSFYFPLWRSSFLSDEPWRMQFEEIFQRPQPRQQLLQTGLNAYFTRANVRCGRVGCVTNNLDFHDRRPIDFEVLAPTDAGAYLAGLKEAVFTSMCLPPLFPYARRGHDLFEDGGVIDNLPISFAALDNGVERPADEDGDARHDLLFVLPLNADFKEEPSETSVLARLYRVMDVRQGALERAGFKSLYLFNELAELRDCAYRLHAASALALGPRHPLNQALARSHRRTDVFAVCPTRSFVQSTLDTVELWKNREAETAFDVMYEATTRRLAQRNFRQPSDLIQVGLVDRCGDVTDDANF